MKLWIKNLKLISLLLLALSIIACESQPEEDEEYASIYIKGITGASDSSKDAWLTANTAPIIHWDSTSIASSYAVEIKNSSGTIVCSRKTTKSNYYKFTNCTLSEGVPYLVYLTYNDTNGDNIPATNNGYQFKIDSQAPNIAFDSVPSDPDSNSSPTFEFSVSDPGSGVGATWCQLDGGSYTPCTSPVTLTLLADGAHTFNVKSVDAVGHISAAQSHSWSIGSGSPSLGDFTISGVQGGADSSNDAYLTNGTQPNVYWGTSNNATNYDIVVRDSSNSTDICSLQNTSATNHNFSSCSLTEGTSYKVVVVAKDGSGNSKTAQNSPFDFTVDSSAPVINFTVTPTDPSTDNTPTFEFTASDATSGVASTECQIDSSGFAACSSPITLPALSAGTHTFELRATDSAGNISGSLSFNWTIMASLGDFNISGVQGGSDSTADEFLTSGLQPHFYWQASANASNYDVTVRNAANSADVCGVQNSTVTNFNFSGCSLTEGSSYNVIVIAKNGSGNTKTALNSPFSFTVDSQAPANNFTVTPSNPSTNATPTFEFTVSDSASGVASIECQLDGGGYSTCTSPYTTPSLADGSHTFEVRSTDNAGNSSSAISYNWSLTSALGDFTISGVQGGSDATADEYLAFGNTAHIYWTSSSNAINYNVVVRDAADSVDVCAQIQTANTDYDFSSCPLTEGATYLVKVSAVDSISNTKSATNDSFSFSVDTTGPTSTISSSPSDPSTDATAAFEFSAVDSVSGVASYECQVDGSGFSACSSPLNLSSLAAGNHTFEVKAIDNLGNTGATQSYSWDITANSEIQIAGSNPYDFSQVAIGTSADYTISLTNIGTSNAETITASSLSAPFSYKDGSYPGTGGTCTATLTNGQSCDVVITFSPSAITNYNASIQFDYVDAVGAKNIVLELLGEGSVTPANAISNLQIISAKINEIDISWTAPNDNGNAITDYIISYKESASSTWLTFNDGVSTDTTVTIDGLIDSTSYDFKVYSHNGTTSLESNIATGETAVDNPFFDPSSYKAINIGDATSSALVAFEDGTEVKLNGTVVANLNAGQTYEFTSVLNDIVEADKPVFVAGSKKNGGNADRKGNMVWATPDWAGKNFLFSGTQANPHLITVYAFEASDITITQNGSTVASQSVASESNYTFSLSQNGGFKMVSTGLIVAHMHSNGQNKVVDPRPLLPASTDIIGFPSNTLQMTPLNDSTNYVAYHGDGTQDSASPLVVGSNTTINPIGAQTSLYQCEAVRVISSDKIVGNSFDDSTGASSAPFLPVAMMKKRYATNVNAEWVAFASTTGGTIDVIDTSGNVVETLTLTRTGSGDAPYKARTVSIPKGYRFESSVKFAAWYEPDSDNYGADDDETIMFGFD